MPGINVRDIQTQPGLTAGTYTNPTLSVNPQGFVTTISSGTAAGSPTDTQVITASEALAAGAFVNIWSNAGAFAVRNADNTVAGKDAHGFVLTAVASGAAATVYFSGLNTAVAGQTPGRVFLGTNGGSSATAPTGTGRVVQLLGIAVAPTVINFTNELPIVLAEPFTTPA